MADLLLCRVCKEVILGPGSMCYRCYLESLPPSHWTEFGEYYDPDDDESWMQEVP